LSEIERFPSVIADIMTSPVITIGIDAKVIDAAKIMAREKIGSIVVVEGDKALGIVTERDLLERLVAEGKDASKVAIGEIMSSPLIHVKKDTSILEAMRTMRRHNIRRLVIMEEDQLVGIVTDKEILKATAMLALVCFRPLLER
jgi:CBS domain-containing protein